MEKKKKRSTNIVIRAFHCDWVLFFFFFFISVCVCARVRAFGVKWQRFSTEPLWSCGVLLFTGWQTQWCIGRGRLGKKPTTLWWNRLCRHRALATYRQICPRSNPSTNKLLLFLHSRHFDRNCVTNGFNKTGTELNVLNWSLLNERRLNHKKNPVPSQMIII